MSDDNLHDAQSSASEQGREFEAYVASSLKYEGWRIDQTHAYVAGAEIDLIATDPHGVAWWIECKGSHRGRTPGLKRGDTTKKAVGVAWYLSTLPDRRPYMLFASHLPSPGSLGERLLTRAREDGLFQDIRRASSASAYCDDLPED